MIHWLVVFDPVETLFSFCAFFCPLRNFWWAKVMVSVQIFEELQLEKLSNQREIYRNNHYNNVFIRKIQIKLIKIHHFDHNFYIWKENCFLNYLIICIELHKFMWNRIASNIFWAQEKSLNCEFLGFYALKTFAYSTREAFHHQGGLFA